MTLEDFKEVYEDATPEKLLRLLVDALDHKANERVEYMGTENQEVKEWCAGEVKVMHDKYGWRSKKRLPDLAKALTDEFQRFYESGVDVERYCDEVDETTGLRFKTFDKGKQFGIDGYSNGEVIL